jgi:hypothetical protein
MARLTLSRNANSFRPQPSPTVSRPAGNRREENAAKAADVRAPEVQIARDAAIRSLKWLPLPVLLCGAIWGFAGMASSAYASTLVVANLMLSAFALAWAARKGAVALMAVALFGYIVRLALITVAVLAVKDASWVKLVPLGLTIIVTHLGLLTWELRYVSASLAFPGLKPNVKEPRSR